MIGTFELILIALVVILLFGSKKIPELAKSLGGFVSEFNKAKEGILKDTTEKKDDKDKK